MTEKQSYITAFNESLQAIWEKSEFKEATVIQEKTASLLLEGKDVIAESPTGTGKTIAYLLPLLHKLNSEKKSAQIVILAPSRELVMQIHQEVQKWSEGSGVSSASFIGGANVKRQVEKLKKSPQVIVGTPGRIYELIKIKKLKMHEVKTIVLDEGDQLLVPEHTKTIQDIIKTTLNERQVVLFSATTNDSTESKARDLMKNPAFITVKRDEIQSGIVEHMYLVCEQRDKLETLERIAKTIPMKALAFVKDIGLLNVVAEKLEFKGLEFGLLHGESTKAEREASIRDFRSGKITLLLATDLAARGLDIEGLELVIHYDLALNESQYIHRSGRTGRLGASGTILSIVTDREARELKKIAKELEIELKKKVLYKAQLMDERK
ncbi:DEAD/DEAH box helicase [Metabacillus herbersteinensis]|uniref:DEAD/DEAH box helicase n=1 Tax=Metabacillus herbersteinensis TaxID=283816 RepID=A0ABV6GJY3_9BACI